MIHDYQSPPEYPKGQRTKIVREFSCKVVGVTFVDAYPNNLHLLEQLAAERYLETDRTEPIPVVLIRNPENPHDANAIQVHVPALGAEMAFIGHIGRHIAARLAPEMDRGERWAAWVVGVAIHPEHPDRPGISIECARVADLETTSG